MKNRLLKFAFLAVFVLLHIIYIPAQSKITRVHDGDSYFIDTVWIRIAGVDCPEIQSNRIAETQPYGRAIGDSVRLMLKGKVVTLQLLGIDRYGRPVYSIYLDGKDVALTLLQKGWAWYAPYEKADDLQRKLPLSTRLKYAAAERKAKKANVGLWKGYDDPITRQHLEPLRPSYWRKIKTFAS